MFVPRNRLLPHPSPVNRVDKTLTLTITKEDSIQTHYDQVLILYDK